MEATHLNFRGKKLRQFPEEIRRATNLTNLNLDDNAITNFDVLTHLPALEVLHVTNNQIGQIPETIHRLKNLKRLYLTNNHLETIPASICELTELKQLLLARNQLKQLPDQLGNLTKLEILNVFDNQLEYLPGGIGQLERLDYLQLGFNQLKQLPVEIKGLKSLTSMEFFGNRIKQLPPELTQLASLTNLNVAENELERIEHIPSSVIRLSIYANPVKYIDAEILASFKREFDDSVPDYFFYLFIDTGQQEELKINPADFHKPSNRRHLKVLDLQQRRIHWHDIKHVPLEFQEKWQLVQVRFTKEF
ncbi:leucine-rich repeat domain-containing protein [Cytophagaceae bacterium YF14B1]|uniref:Leucine-rich repeat domain-containing protein n=1 Tax=Xanthocytophaga flava TaxID=3048013 RepID=A0AAE3QK66_9BACT|nr:leucine-rich repeat domain-containing protein [Xanthocytophaga flavus]MDJ1480877.1 leucine-rich repeat domain-containing protein [Xanthocytophaga flavus]